MNNYNARAMRQGYNYIKSEKMACVGAFWTLLWGRNVSVCGDSYRVIRRIGEGGKYMYISKYKNYTDCVYKGFSYVDLVHRQGHHFALVSAMLGSVCINRKIILLLL